MSVRALITEGVGPGGSVLYALTGGLDIGAAPAPVVITDIKSGQLKMRAGTLALKNESGALQMKMRAGELVLKNESGAVSLRTFGQSLHLVITS